MSRNGWIGSNYWRPFSLNVGINPCFRGLLAMMSMWKLSSGSGSPSSRRKKKQETKPHLIALRPNHIGGCFCVSGRGEIGCCDALPSFIPQSWHEFLPFFCLFHSSCPSVPYYLLFFFTRLWTPLRPLTPFVVRPQGFGEPSNQCMFPMHRTALFRLDSLSASWYRRISLQVL